MTPENSDYGSTHLHGPHPLGLENTEWQFLSEKVKNLVLNPLLHNNVVTQLTRLSTVKQYKLDLGPEERLGLAVQAINQGITSTATLNHLDPETISRATRQTLAAIMFLEKKRGDESSNIAINTEVEQLTMIDEKLSRAAQIVDLPHMHLVLDQLPHVDTLLRYYLKYRTVGSLLKKRQVPYTTHQLMYPEAYLLGETIEESLIGISALAQRFVFGNWLYVNHSQNSLVSKAAVVILTQDYADLPESFRLRLAGFRLALREWMDEEYEQVKVNHLEDEKLFPKNYTGDLPSVIKAYQKYATAKKCPTTIKDFAVSVVAGVPQKDRIKKIRPGQFFSDETRRGLDWHLSRFLENTLISQKSSARGSLYELYMTNTPQLLREAKLKALKVIHRRQKITVGRGKVEDRKGDGIIRASYGHPR